MLGELADDERTVVVDMEAGSGTLSRMSAGAADAVLVVVEPSVKSIQAAERLVAIASSQHRTTLLANKIRSDDEVAQIRTALPGHDLVPIPYDPAIEQSDRDGVAAIDLAPDSPGVDALRSVAARLLDVESPRRRER